MVGGRWGYFSLSARSFSQFQVQTGHISQPGLCRAGCSDGFGKSTHILPSGAPGLATKRGLPGPSRPGLGSLRGLSLPWAVIVKVD